MHQRLYIEKRPEYADDHALTERLKTRLDLAGLQRVRRLAVYDLYDCPEALLPAAISRVFSDPVSDEVRDALLERTTPSLSSRCPDSTTSAPIPPDNACACWTMPSRRPSLPAPSPGCLKATWMTQPRKNCAPTSSTPSTAAKRTSPTPACRHITPHPPCRVTTASARWMAMASPPGTLRTASP